MNSDKEDGAAEGGHDAVLEQYDEALHNYESSLDELGAACDAADPSDVENAVAVIDSTLDKLLEKARALSDAHRKLNDTSQEDLGLKLNEIMTNKRLAADAVSSTEKTMEQASSDGEMLEEILEKLIEIADELYHNLEEV